MPPSIALTFDKTFKDTSRRTWLAGGGHTCHNIFNSGADGRGHALRIASWAFSYNNLRANFRSNTRTTRSQGSCINYNNRGGGCVLRVISSAIDSNPDKYYIYIGDGKQHYDYYNRD